MLNAIPVNRTSLLLAFVAAAAALSLLVVPVHANPPGRATVWANGQLYNAVVPQTPDGSVQFPHVPDGNTPSVAELETTDSLYIVATNTETPLVSDAAPGDRDYNGGRWLPYMVEPTGAGAVPELTSEEAVIQAANDGLVTITGPGGVFICPLTGKAK